MTGKRAVKLWPATFYKPGGSSIANLVEAAITASRENCLLPNLPDSLITLKVIKLCRKLSKLVYRISNSKCKSFV